MSTSAPDSPEIKPTWAATFRVYLEPSTLRMLTLGFSAGLPLLLVLGTLSFWLREAGIDAIFLPGTNTQDVVAYLRAKLRAA